MMESFGPVLGAGWLTWMPTPDGLTIVDCGWELSSGHPVERSAFAALEAAAAEFGPVRQILLTHDHWDHTADLPHLLARWPGCQVYAHENSRAEGVTIRLQGGEVLDLGGAEITVLYTPGHSEARDELCYYLAAERFLFSGDVAQPQGPSFSFATGPSPVPYFHHAALYRTTLERLVRLNPAQMRTGHGQFLGPEQSKQYLRVTLATLQRMEELALSLVERHADWSSARLAERLYDQIAEERHVRFRIAEARKKRSAPDAPSDYERYDFPGIQDLILAARAALGEDEEEGRV